MFIKKIGMLSHNALAFTMIGAVLVGALGAVLAFAPPRFSSPANSAQTQPGKTSPGDPSQQEDSTATQQALATTAPTSTAIAPTATPVAPTATATPPRPTPTNTPTPTLRGTVVSVNTSAGQFVVRQSFTGTLITVAVTGQTTYQGLASSLGTMTVGWRARVTGSFQADGTWKALNVYTYIDN